MSCFWKSNPNQRIDFHISDLTPLWYTSTIYSKYYIYQNTKCNARKHTKVLTKCTFYTEMAILKKWGRGKRYQTITRYFRTEAVKW